MDAAGARSPDELRELLAADPTRSLVELVAERLDVAVGTWTVELCLVDGRLEKLYRKNGPIGARALEPEPREATLE